MHNKNISKYRGGTEKSVINIYIIKEGHKSARNSQPYLKGVHRSRASKQQRTHDPRAAP